MCVVASTGLSETSLFTIGRWLIRGLSDNTSALPRIIASEERGQLQVGEAKLYNDLAERYGKP